MTYEIGTEHSLKVLLELKSKSFMTMIFHFLSHDHTWNAMSVSAHANTEELVW